MRKSILIPVGLGAVSVAALVLASAFEFVPQLVWNASASAPIGLYRIERRPPEIGDFVIVKPDAALEQFTTDRGYLPPEIPLLKRVSALAGDQICREKERISVNKIHVADALFFDSAGRKMPVWSGCFRLNAGETFLLNASERSFDGRYFGARDVSQIIGIARPVWIKTSAKISAETRKSGRKRDCAIVRMRRKKAVRARLKHWCNERPKASLHVEFLCTIPRNAGAKRCKRHG